MEIREDRIKELEQRGFKRWTKEWADRLYVNATKIGLDCDYYNTGNIHHAEFDGEHISNNEARRLKSAKTYIDLKTGRVYSDSYRLKNKVEAILKEVI